MLFYDPTGAGPGFETIGLTHNPFNALIVPRPIGWISTLAANGTPNLAPYSYFNAVSANPPRVMFTSSGPQPGEGGEKHSLRNIRATGHFTVNLATHAQRHAMNGSSAPAPADIDEFAATGLLTLPGHRTQVPRVRGAPAHLECTLAQIVDLREGVPDGTIMVIGRVLGIHIDPAVITDGQVDIARAQPIARVGYLDYATVTETWTLPRPTWP